MKQTRTCYLASEVSFRHAFIHNMHMHNDSIVVYICSPACMLLVYACKRGTWGDM